MTYFSAQRLPSIWVECAKSARRALFFSNQASLQADAVKRELAQYSTDEQKQILRVINEYTPQELTRFDVTKRRAENLKLFRKEHGNFADLGQVLNVQGLGVRGVERLCDSILVNMAAADQGGGTFQLQTSPKPIVKKATTKASLLIPVLSEKNRCNLRVAVGIHVGLNAVSWASIDRNKRLLEWDFFALNFEPKKIHPTAVLASVLELRDVLPDADAYVMEDFASTNQPAQQQITSLSVQLQKSQLTAMMLAVLNTTNKSLENDTSGSQDRVYYLRSRTPARLFRTLVGAERVSAQSAVKDIISPLSNVKAPVHYTPISVDCDLSRLYFSKTNIEKENMCQALLLTMAFMDLMVYQTPQSLKVVSAR